MGALHFAHIERLNSCWSAILLYIILWRGLRPEFGRKRRDLHELKADLGAAMTEVQPKTAAEMEAEQEAMLAKKYGGMKPKQRLIPKEQKFFDSADWQLQKQGVKGPEQPATPSANLAPRLASKQQLQHDTGPKGRRRASHLGETEDEY